MSVDNFNCVKKASILKCDNKEKGIIYEDFRDTCRAVCVSQKREYFRKIIEYGLKYMKLLKICRVKHEVITTA